MLGGGGYRVTPGKLDVVDYLIVLCRAESEVVPIQEKFRDTKQLRDQLLHLGQRRVRDGPRVRNGLEQPIRKIKTPALQFAVEAFVRPEDPKRSSGRSKNERPEDPTRAGRPNMFCGFFFAMRATQQRHLTFAIDVDHDGQKQRTRCSKQRSKSTTYNGQEH